MTNSIQHQQVVSARKFARDVHKDEFLVTVQGDHRPKMEHLQEVADLVWASGGSETEIAAAWLHDSVEDTPTTIKDIEEKFGKEIADIVDGLTDPVNFASLPTDERKRLQAERVRNKSVNVKRVKLADQTSNVRLFSTDPKATWTLEKKRVYVIGAKQIADECKGVSPVLDELFNKEYEQAVKTLGI